MNRYRTSLLSALLVCGGGLFAQGIPHPDHHEFEAALFAPFRGDNGEGRVIKVAFQFPDAPALTLASWRLDLVSPNGRIVHTWHGETPLIEGKGWKHLSWDGRDRQGNPLPAGFYSLRLTAASLPESDYRVLPGGDAAGRVEARFQAVSNADLETEEATILIGSVKAPVLPPFAALPSASGDRSRGSLPTRVATSALPYTIYFGNMHSQTNHSDGGTPVASCGGAEVPQGGTMGPTEAFEMARVQAGCDFLLASEHNHMYDGSTGTNANADPAAAKALWQSGADAAPAYRTSHPTFMAMYGNEWGVISNGGHMNLLNPDGLPGWEYNGSSQLIGHFFTAKSDYAAMYALMKQRGWIGQFNHAKTSGQFLVGGTALGYDANGADVMALCEVMNSSAFSTNTTETETSRSFYTGAWNTLLERGYKVAPTTDQDNHCANWGLSYTNRTGVLLPSGGAQSHQAFLDAVKARRVFATMDKSSQLILTANNGVMGESFSNSGALTLTANYASTNPARSASRVQFFEGVPGRNGTVTQLIEGQGAYTFTPAAGDHFYYAVITQDNGDQLWSAPVWVNQGLGTPDTTAPTVSASETGTSGAITLSASATDNVGISKVEFYVDGTLKGTSTAAPYSLSLASTTLTNGTHSLVAKAYDAAGNIGSSTAVSFTINNTDTQAPSVSASETGSSGTITLSATATDNVGVSKVEFYVDSTLKGTSTASPYALSLASSTLTNGTHSLVAKAYDTAGNVGTSTAVAFTINNPVADTTPPSVTASETGTSGAISLTATATDNVGVTNVEFYVDGVLKGSSTTAPYALSLDSTTLANGSHSLVVKAYDAAANVGTSAAVSFSISNTAGTFQEVESNGTRASANAVNRTYTSIRGTMGNTTDKDYFALSVNPGETLSLAMTGPASTDYDLYLVNGSDATLVSSTGGTSTENLAWKNTATTAATVYAKVISYSGSSTTTPYVITIGYAQAALEKVLNGGFESGAASWIQTSGVITNSSSVSAHAGSYKAWLCGYGSVTTDYVYQDVAIPASATAATFSFWLDVTTTDPNTTTAYDTLKVQVRNTSGTILATLATYSNLNAAGGYAKKSFDLTAYKGQTVRLYFLGVENASYATSFIVDDVSLLVN